MIWAQRGPVLTVDAPGVALKEVGVGVTIPDGEGEADVALKVVDGTRPMVEKLSMRGRVVGLGEEGGGRKLPDVLDLGTFAPYGESRFVVGVRVFVPCRLVSRVSGLGIEPDSLLPGEHDVVLSIRDVPTRTLVAGSMEFRSAALARTVAITGDTVGAEGIRPVSNLRLWG